MVDLLHAARVAPALEPRVEPAVQDLHPFLLAHEARRQHQHIGVVVLARQLGDLRAPGDRGAHPRKPVGDVRHPESRTAGQHAARGYAAAHRLRHRPTGCTAWVVTRRAVSEANSWPMLAGGVMPSPRSLRAAAACARARAASTRVAMSASLNCTPSNSRNAWPNCLRSAQ